MEGGIVIEPEIPAPLARLGVARDVEGAAVYFLVREERVVYIGQSRDVVARVVGHMKQGRIDFDDVLMLPVDEVVELTRIESGFIAIYRPPHNKRHAARGGSWLTEARLRLGLDVGGAALNCDRCAFFRHACSEHQGDA